MKYFFFFTKYFMKYLSLVTRYKNTLYNIMSGGLIFSTARIRTRRLEVTNLSVGGIGKPFLTSVFV